MPAIRCTDTEPMPNTATAFPIDVERTPEGDYLLQWADDFTQAEVDVSVGTTPAGAIGNAPLLRGVRSGARVAGVPETRRGYFWLRPSRGEPTLAAERALLLDVGTNFRDLGGYRTEGGRRVAWGRLFRSGHTTRLSERDVAYLEALDIRVCCDFRREDEHHVEPPRLPRATRIVNIPIDPGSTSSFFSRLAAGEVTPPEMAAFMQEANRDFVHHHTQQFKRMFNELLAVEDGAFMFNCAAGKDRTGFAAAMILAALGVREEDIVADYLLSGRYFPIERELTRIRHKYADHSGRALDPELILPMMQTRPEYISAAFAAIREDYASVDHFLAEALGVDVDARRDLRARFTV